MQFNLVVSTNSAGMRCWQKNGFQVVGTLRGACRHQRLGYVDSLVMVQGLLIAGQFLLDSLAQYIKRIVIKI